MVEFKRGISFKLKESDRESDIETKNERNQYVLELLHNIDPFVLLKIIVLNVSFEVYGTRYIKQKLGYFSWNLKNKFKDGECPLTNDFNQKLIIYMSSFILRGML